MNRPTRTVLWQRMRALVLPEVRVIEKMNARHSRLIAETREVDDLEKLLPEVEDFYKHILAAGESVPPGSERDLLKALVQFWATYLYDHTGTFPKTDLQPYNGPIFRWAPTFIWAFAILFGLLAGLYSIFGSPFSSSSREARATQTQFAADQTQFANIQYESTQTALTPPTPSETVPVRTPTDTPEPSATPTPTPTGTNTPEADTSTPTASPLPAGMAVHLNNLEEGQEISPRTRLVVSYANLQPGWTIHLLVQPISAGGKFYPLESFYTVPEEATSGEWAFDASFSAGSAIDTREQYNILPVVALDGSTRAALKAAAQTGLDEIPAKVLTLPQVVTEIITVNRSPSQHISGVRLVYSSYLKDQGNADIMIALPDGSGLLQLAITPDITELYPCFSPTGMQVAYVARQRSDEGKAEYSVWIMDSDGQNRLMVEGVPGVIYEQPRWSPDGRYLAYAASETAPSIRKWSIILYDLSTGEKIDLTGSLIATARYPAWAPDGKSILFSGIAPRSYTAGILKIDLATQEISVIYDTPAEEIQPAISPDGQRLAFLAYSSSASESNRDIFMVDLETGKSLRLTEHESLDQAPAWSADGRSVYFETFRTGEQTLWVVNSDGSGTRQITYGRADSSAWLGPVDVFIPLDRLE